MKIKIFMVLAIAAIAFTLMGETINIESLVNPDAIVVDADKAYVAEKASIYIFSLKDFKLLKKFGSEGAGPGEFMTKSGAIKLNLFLTQKNLVVDSLGKISFFSKEGVFEKEIRKTNPLKNYYPFGSQFICATIIEDEKKIQYLTLQSVKEESDRLIEDKSFFKIKNDFQRSKLVGGFNPLTPFPLKLSCKENKIFFEVTPGNIFVLDQFGKKLFVLKPNAGKLNVSEKLKEEVYDYYRAQPNIKPYFEALKKKMEFPDVFPDVHDFRIDNKKVYVLPYAVENGKKYFYVYDLNGKFQKKIMAPLQEENILKLYPYTIANDKLYQFVETEDGESWEIHIETLKSNFP